MHSIIEPALHGPGQEQMTREITTTKNLADNRTIPKTILYNNSESPPTKPPAPARTPGRPRPLQAPARPIAPAQKYSLNRTAVLMVERASFNGKGLTLVRLRRAFQFPPAIEALEGPLDSSPP